jgi:NADP-dependent 3-hydroxy acid dehydrogenase YdfG
MYKISQKYPQKRAFITGAASGIGKALALELAKDNWTIGIADINALELAYTAQSIMQSGGKALVFSLDISDKVQFAQVAEDFLAQTQGIDLLFNNAGVGDGDVFEYYSLDNWDWLVKVNLMGMIYGTHLFLPTFKKQKSGHIINLSSASAILGVAYIGPYAVTKAGIRSASETLYCELKEFGIGVSVVMPTFVKTNITQHARAEKMRIIGNYSVSQSKITAQFLAQIILKKISKNKFYIVEPLEARILWFLTRFSPMFALNYMIKHTKKEEELAYRVSSE